MKKLVQPKQIDIDKHKTLTATLARWASTDGSHSTVVPGLTLHRYSAPTEPTIGLYEPSVCVIAQGAKKVMLGDECFEYDATHALLTSIDVPVMSQVIQASQAKPYLSLMLSLDIRSILHLLADTEFPRQKREGSARAMSITPFSSSLYDAILRLVRLLDEPDHIPVLAPLLQQEIAFRLLIGPLGPRLRQILAVGCQGHQIAKAILWLKQNFSSPLHVKELAAKVNMSPSTFYHHFRTITGMSPLQFQKQLRLQEARRLMLHELADAGSAALQVGYESASQFSREYSRIFGAPPLRDITLLREASTLGNAAHIS